MKKILRKEQYGFEREHFYHYYNTNSKKCYNDYFNPEDEDD